jgi:nucleoside-diphosphate-sugar epimerase
VARGDEVFALARRSVQVSGVRVLVPASPAEIGTCIAEAAPTTVFHLATQYVSDHRPDQVAELIAANITYGALLLEGLRQAGVRRLVQMGSAWQRYHAVEDAYRPVNLYAATKQAFEDLLAWYVDAGHLDAVTVRVADTYGLGDTRRKIVSLLIEAARDGIPLELSPGEQRLDLLAVEDVVAALLRAEELVGPGHQAFRIGADRTLTLRELADLIGTLVGRRVPARWGVRPYRSREVMRPWDGGTLLPGWTAGTELRQGLQRLVDEACTSSA